jgi:hypothetical protein
MKNGSITRRLKGRSADLNGDGGRTDPAAAVKYVPTTTPATRSLSAGRLKL